MSPRRPSAPDVLPAVPRRVRSTSPKHQRMTGDPVKAAITASAASFGDGGDNDGNELPPPTVARMWQEEAWTYFELVPELQNAALFYGACLSRCALVPAFENDEGEVSTTFDDEAPASSVEAAQVSGEIAEFIRRLRPTTGGQPGLLKGCGSNLGVTGELYLVNESGLDGTGPWDVLSVNELRPNAGPESTRRKSTGASDVKWMRWNGPGYRPHTLGPESFIVRVWQPHPRYGMQPHSSVKGCLPHLENLVLLDREMRGTTVSRLASAGLLLLSDEIDYPSDEDAPDGTEGDDPLTRDLIAAAATAISDKSSAAGAIPIILRASTDAIRDGAKFLSFAKVDDAVSMAKRRELVERFANGYDLPVEVILGHMNCVSDDTEILTTGGWRPVDEVSVGDEVLTLNHDTGVSEWQPVERVNLFPVTDHPMVALDGQFHSSLSTLDHRWPVITQRGRRRWRESRQLSESVRLIPAAPPGDMPTDPKWSDAIVELVAWYWTEGADGRGDGVVIHQSERANPDHVAAIRGSLTELCGPAHETLYRSSRAHGRAVCSFPDCGWPVHSDGLCSAHRYQARHGVPLRPVRRNRPHPGFTDDTRPAWREKPAPNGMRQFHLNKPLANMLRVAAPGKVVAVDWLRTLTRSQLELFIRRSVDGDGWAGPRGNLQLHQSNAERADVFGIACAMSGRGVSYKEQVSMSQFGESARHLVLTRGAAPHRIRYGIRKSEVRYTGRVWCPTVENGTWLARRNGKVYFTGNTTFANAFQISEDLFRAHIEPKLTVICDGLTAGALHPWLRLRHGIGQDQPLPPDLARRRIHYNASKLVSHPDRSNEATEGRKLFLISDEAWRRANGFTEDDAMSPDELATAINIVRQTNVKETIRAEDTNVTPILDPNLNRPEVQPGAPDRHDQDPLAASITPIGVLAMRLASAADATVERAVERAQAQLVNLAKRSPDATTQIDGVAKSLIAASLGRARVDAMTAGRHALFVGEFDAFRRRAGAYAREHGCSDPDALACAATDEVERLARKRLYDPDVAVGLESFAHLVARAGFVNASAVPAGPSRELSGAG